MKFKDIEQFVLKNQKIVSGVMIAVLVIVIAALGYFRYYLPGQNQEAQEALFQSQLYFEQDSFAQALNGDGLNKGAVAVADEYGSTAAGNLARYIAGVSYLYLNDFDNAISYLEDYKQKDEIIAAMSQMALGDAYMEKGRADNSNYEKGLAAYKEAAAMTTNEYVAPKILFKLGRAYEYFDKKSEALDQYNKILEEYPNFEETQDVKKYVAKLEVAAV